MLQSIKNGFSNSGTLMLAAASIVGGAITTVASQVDVSHLVNEAIANGFNGKVAAAVGITALVQGILMYATRIHGTTTVEVAGNPRLAPVVPSAAKVTNTGPGKAVVVKK